VKNARKIALTANLTATAVALRFIKHGLMGPLQFINIPGIFALTAGTLLGPLTGFLVSVLIFLTSDFFLGFGPWSIVTSSMCGVIGGIAGLLWRKRATSRVEVLIISFILFLIYDVSTSFLLYIPLMSPMEALIMGIIGLFTPVMGGGLYAVGPITELSSSIVSSILIGKIKGGEIFVKE